MQTYPAFDPESEEAEGERCREAQRQRDLYWQHEEELDMEEHHRNCCSRGVLQKGKTMTLEALYLAGAAYAFNEITGQIVQFIDGPAGAHKTVVPGKTSPDVLCTLLFDEKAISESWNALSLREARERIGKYCSHLLRPVDGESGICNSQLRFGARLAGQNDFLSFTTQIV